MEKFTETIHCQSRAHCARCISSEKWRKDIMANFEWDGKCPLNRDFDDKRKEIKYQEEVLQRMIERGCKSCEKKRQEKYIERLKSEMV